MPLAALILAQSDGDAGAATQPLLLTLGGQTLLERIAYQARRAGAQHIVICAGPLPAAMVGAMDRMKARGLDVSLARSPREAADRLHPDEDVLVFSTAVFVEQAEFEELAGGEGAVLLTLPEAWGRDRFERIDSEDNWAGVARLPAGLIRETAAMLGDWDFAPTLLRRAVQHGVARARLPLRDEAETDDIAPLVQDDLAGTARAIARNADVAAEGVVERFGLMPPLRHLASWIALKPVSATMTAAAAVASGAGALAAAVANAPLVAFPLLLLTAAIALLTVLLGQTGVPEIKRLSRLLRWRSLLAPLVILALAAHGFAGWRGDWPKAVLALWLGVQSLLLLHGQARGARLPEMRLGGAGAALVLLISYGAGWSVAGLAVCLAEAVALQFRAQNKKLPD